MLGAHGRPFEAFMPSREFVAFAEARLVQASAEFHRPLATTETRALSEGPRPGEAQPQNRATILVVDDEEMVRRLAARMLVTFGYRVLEARSGQEAVRLLRRGAHRIDGVLTDVAMPGIGGRELGETIARCWPQIRVLYMSGFAAKQMVNNGALDPSVPFIQKPFTSEQLGRRMRELLAQLPNQ
jgi:two-component system, cell cycle sensor histidine kinase and response regulator CckA